MMRWRRGRLRINKIKGGVIVSKQKQKVLNTRLTPEAFDALKQLGKLYPREVSLTQIASQAVIEKLKAETYA